MDTGDAGARWGMSRGEDADSSAGAPLRLWRKLKAEARQLKETLAEVLIENRLLKKSVLGDGEDAS
jgi:hypothetical protein